MNPTRPDSETRRALMRLLHGELPPDVAARLERRLDAEPSLAAEYRRLEAAWKRLEAPPPSPVPPGFAQRTARRILERETPLRWSLVPLPVRAAAAAALVAGILLGAGLGARLEGSSTGGSLDRDRTADLNTDLATDPTGEMGFDDTWTAEQVGFGTSLAEQYWQTLEDGELSTVFGEEAEPTS